MPVHSTLANPESPAERRDKIADLAKQMARKMEEMAENASELAASLAAAVDEQNALGGGPAKSGDAVEKKGKKCGKK